MSHKSYTQTHTPSRNTDRHKKHRQPEALSEWPIWRTSIVLYYVLYQSSLWLPDFYSEAKLLAMQLQQFRPSVRPSVTRWYPIQTNEDRITRSSL